MKKIFIKFILFFIFISIILFNIEIDKQSYNYVYKDNYLYIKQLKTKKEKSKTNNKETKKETNTLESFTGVVTAYSPYCTGCIGITASGYNVKNTIYYKDKEYGKLRVLAADKKYKFGSIIKLSNIDNYNEIYGIVLDRGSAIGNNKKSQIDLLFAKEHECVTFGRKHNVKIEVLRYGF